MLDLASMVLAAYFFVHAQIGISGVPMPVVIERGTSYSYSEIYSNINVPLGWTSTCANQKKMVYYMTEHYAAFDPRYHSKPLNGSLEIANKWICVQ